MKLNFFLIFSLLFITGACASKTEAPNILAVPKAIAIDKTNNRLFVAESEDNSLSVINLTTNEIIGGAPLLTTSSSIQLPSLVQDIEVANLGSGTSRLFIIGNSAAPRNRITVLDYDSTLGLRVASISPIIVGTNTGADTSDILGGLSYDSVHSTFIC